MHISVIDVGEELPMWVLGSHFGCPLCPKVKPTSLKKIKGHFEGHINTALHFREKIICRCNMPCRGLAHYHCPYCYKTLLVKRHMERHVKLCSTRTTLIVVTPTQSPQLPLSTSGRLPPPLQADSTPKTPLPVPPPLLQHDLTPKRPLPVPPPLLQHDYTLKRPLLPSPPLQTDSTPKRPLPSPPPPPLQSDSTLERPPLHDHDYTLLALTSRDSTEDVPNSTRAPSPPQLVSTPERSTPPPSTVDSVDESEELSSAKASGVKYLKRTKCPHCALILYKKNLNVHIQRKHVKNRCLCGKCEAMATAEESMCCREVDNYWSLISRITPKLEVECLTQHPGFESCCLNPYVLEIAYMHYRQEHGPLLASRHEQYRYTAYRQIVRWAYGYLGRHINKPIPACVVSAIRRQFPEGGDFNGFQWPNLGENE